MLNVNKGYNSLLEYRMRRVLPLAAQNHIKVITNMGSSNLEAAGKLTRQLADKLGIHNLRIAYVTGDDITDQLNMYYGCKILETGRQLGEIKDNIISASVYMGAEGIVEALKRGADIVITGRVSDPALSVAPLVYEFGWDIQRNPEKMGQSILIGHLLECVG